MKWVFVDYENVGSLDGLDIGSYERLFVFLGPKHDELNLGKVPVKAFARMELLRMRKSSNNNLDFHLAFYLGVLHSEAEEGVEFVVFSNDTGFDGVVGHLRDLGRECVREGNGNHDGVVAAQKDEDDPKRDPATNPQVTVKQICEGLAKLEAGKRPRKKNTLIRWMVNLYQIYGEDEGVDRVLRTMVRSKWVDFDGERVVYSLKNLSDENG